MLRDYHGEFGDGTRILLEGVYSRVAIDGGVRTPSGDGVECGVLN